MNAKKPQSRELIAPEFKNPNRDVVGNREIDSQALSGERKPAGALQSRAEGRNKLKIPL